jgi:uncharacterized protein
MPALCDVNVLLALCYERHTHHPKAVAWLEEQNDDDVVLCRSTQMSLLRLLCHRTVMGQDVCSLDQAWGIYDTILKDARFRFCEEPAGLERQWRNLTQGKNPSPQLWQDAYLAAFALAAGFSLVTVDKGFEQFTGLALTLL